MKNEIRLALLFMAATAVPSFAQDNSPQCGSTNFDQSRNLFTNMNPAADAVNQQCFITVYPNGAMPSQAEQYPASYLVAGSYIVELSGGGGGGGGGAAKQDDKVGGGGGGGGASAGPSRTVQNLAPGVYKLTIGTGGDGGNANGGRTEDGNPTSLTNAYSGQLIAGFQGADVWRQGSRAAGSGRGGVAKAGGSSGQSGDMSQVQTAGYVGMAEQSGGSGGASAGSSGLGAGGSGGSGGPNTANAGGRGGDGFIKLALQEAAPVAQAAAPAPTAAQAPFVPASEPSVSARPAKRDRN